MPVFVASRGGFGRGGTGFTLGPAQNTFGDTTTANRAAAEALRDTYATNNAAWLALYNADRNNFIQLIWNGGDVVQRRNVPGNAWEDGTNIIIGPNGPPGSNGAPGGGAWSSLGTAQEINVTRASEVFIGTGINLPTGRSAYGYRLGGNAADFAEHAGIMVISAALLDGVTAAVAGTTSAAATRVRFPEFGGGGLVAGSLYAGLTATRELLIATSNADQNFAIEVFDYVPSAVQGRRTDAEIDQLIAAYTGGIPGLNIPDSQLPASIMRDSEFTAAAVRGLLSLSAAEVNDLLTGATLSGSVLTFTQNDGTTVAITLPTTGGVADGVVSGAAFAGTTLTLTLSTGGTVTVDMGPVLDARFLNQASNLSDVPAPGTALTNLGGLNTAGVRSQAVSSFQLVSAFPASPYNGQKVLFTGPAMALADTVDENGDALTMAILGDGFEYVTAETRWERRIRLIADLVARVTALEGGGVHTLTRYAALRADGATPGDFTEADFLGAGATNSMTQDITTPASATNMVVGIAVPVSEGVLTGVAELAGDGSVNQFATMIRGDFLPTSTDVGDQVTLNIDGDDHYVYCTNAIVRAIFLGVIGYRLTQTSP